MLKNRLKRHRIAYAIVYACAFVAITAINHDKDFGFHLKTVITLSVFYLPYEMFTRSALKTTNKIKRELIKTISTLLDGEYLTTGEMELSSSPVLYHRGNVMFLIEGFYQHEVEYCVYHDEVIIDSGRVEYNDIDIDTLQEIRDVITEYYLLNSE